MSVKLVTVPCNALSNLRQLVNRLLLNQRQLSVVFLFHALLDEFLMAEFQIY